MTAKTKKLLMTVAAIVGVVLMAGIVIRNKGNLKGIASDMQQIIGIKL